MQTAAYVIVALAFMLLGAFLVLGLQYLARHGEEADCDPETVVPGDEPDFDETSPRTVPTEPGALR